jgi:pectin methylesterase-like acyl-CoA thioesterase
VSSSSIANTYGHYAQGCQCQAIALSAQNERQGFYGVSLTGYQDTLLANQGKAVYAKSAVSGAVDFIFGQVSPSYFYASDIISTSLGAITAPGRLSADSPQVYVFDQCKVIAASDAASNTTGSVLGRPWKAYGRVVFRNSAIGSHISVRQNASDLLQLQAMADPDALPYSRPGGHSGMTRPQTSRTRSSPSTRRLEPARMMPTRQSERVCPVPPPYLSLHA